MSRTAGLAPSRPVGGRPQALRTGFALRPGMRVGLFGGSFNPAHEGHAHVADTALARLGLDRVIWLVSPQNPLKSSAETEAQAARMAGARRFARGPSMIVSDIESRLGSAYTIDTLRALRARFAGVHFVWIMGADNLVGFHRWRGWMQILKITPVAVIARPGTALKGRLALMASRFAAARLPASRARCLATARPPAWIYLPAPLNFTSSTALRGKARSAAAIAR